MDSGKQATHTWMFPSSQTLTNKMEPLLLHYKYIPTCVFSTVLSPKYTLEISSTGHSQQ